MYQVSIYIPHAEFCVYGLGMTIHEEFCMEWVRDDNLSGRQSWRDSCMVLYIKLSQLDCLYKRRKKNGSSVLPHPPSWICHNLKMFIAVLFNTSENLNTHGTFQVALVVNNPHARAGDAGDSSLIPGLEKPQWEEITTHSTILAWRIPWTERSLANYDP